MVFFNDGLVLAGRGDRCIVEHFTNGVFKNDFAPKNFFVAKFTSFNSDLSVLEIFLFG